MHPIEKDKIIVIDNILTDTHLSMLLESVKSTEFPWYYLPNTHTAPTVIEEYSHGFIHWLQEPEKFGKAPSIYLNIFSPVLYILLDKANMEFRGLIRSRVNLSTRSSVQHKGYPHVDWIYDEPYYSAIFYLEDSDGDTCFYNVEDDGYSEIHLSEDIKVIKRVTPKRNRAVIFQGNIAHSAMLPLNHNTRTVVNFCFYSTPK